MPGRYLFLLLIISLPIVAAGQTTTEPLEVFGYFQSTFDHSSDNLAIMGIPEASSVRNTFILQQANIFFRKEFNARFSAFVDLEFTNTYASTRNWGTFRLEEAWARYRVSEALNIKAGLLVPTFNNLNEIKNRMPLLPYITRPFVYEAAAEGVGSLDDFAPASAFLQIDGALPLDDCRLDYAVYAGNGDPSFISTGQSGQQYTIGGTDTTTFKMVGARLGVRVGKLKAGYSMTSDKANHRDIGIGPVHRLRFGGDLSYSLGSVSLEAEIVATNEYLDDRQAMIYTNVARLDPRLGKEPSNLFAYGVLTYDLSESYYVYGGLEYLDTHKTSVTRGFMAGGGFRPIDNVVLKAQYLHISNEFQNLSSFLSNRVQLGISVMF